MQLFKNLKIIKLKFLILLYLLCKSKKQKILKKENYGICTLLYQLHFSRINLPFVFMSSTYFFDNSIV